MNTRLFSELVGKRVTSIDAKVDQAEAEIIAGNLRVQILHRQDCCESVAINRVLGDPSKLIGEVVTLAEEDSREPDKFQHDFGSYHDSHTWSSYYIEAGGHRLEIWFLGESNGYYSESTEVEITDMEGEK